MRWQNLLLWTCTAALAASGCSAEDAPGGFDGPAVYVDGASGADGNAGNASSPMKTLAAAVKKAAPGDTIVVAAGTYAEGLVLPPGVHFKGEGVAKTIVAPPAGSTGILITGGGDAKIEGVSVRKATGTGILASGTNLELVDVEVSGTLRDKATGAPGHGVQSAGAALLTLKGCTVGKNLGVGVVAAKVATVSIIDPAFSVSPLGGSGAVSIIDPAFSPKSNISGNWGGGVAIIDPAFAPGARGKTDGATPSFDIQGTLIGDNKLFAVALYGASGTIRGSALIGSQKLVSSRAGTSDVAEGLVVADGSDGQASSSVAIEDDCVIGGNARAGVLVSAHAQVNVSGAVRTNSYGGVWAQGKDARIALDASAVVSDNDLVGVAVTFGAGLEAKGARISGTRKMQLANPAGGLPVEVGDGVGVFDQGRAALNAVQLLDNGRAGVVAHRPGTTGSGSVDLQVSGSKFVGGQFGIVVNEAGQTGAGSVPAADLEKNNAFEGLNNKVDPAGKLEVEVSPCGQGKSADTKCTPPASEAP